MIDATRTTTVLLEGLFDSDNHAAWSEFDARYRPVLVAFALRLGLGESDASDVAQETLVRFLREYREGKYDRDRGRLRSWLVGIARTRIAAVFRRRDVKREVRGVSAMVDLDDDGALSQIWDTERRSVILGEAMNELRDGTRLSPGTIDAFELLVLRQMPVASVAERLGVSSHDVYLAKSRVAERLRGIVDRLEHAFEETTA